MSLKHLRYNSYNECIEIDETVIKQSAHHTFEHV